MKVIQIGSELQAQIYH